MGNYSYPKDSVGGRKLEIKAKLNSIQKELIKELGPKRFKIHKFIGWLIFWG